MRRLFIATVFAGLGAAAVAAPDYAGRAFGGDSALTDAVPAPVVADRVQDIVDAAKREADEIAATARENGIPVSPVEHEIRQRLQFRSPEIVSVLREDRAYGGHEDGASEDGTHEGTNGSLWLIPVNWDARTGALIPIQAVLGDRQAAYDRAAALIHDAAVAQVWGGDPRGWAAAIEAAVQPDPMYLATFTFVPSTAPDRIGGIAWHFEPGMIAPGARGAVSVVVPQAALRDVVAPEWRALFAGEPAGILDAPYLSPDDERLQEVVARY